jgi:hypothetical protein
MRALRATEIVRPVRRASFGFLVGLVVLAGCGGSGGSELKQAAAELRRQSIPAPSGGQQFPTNVSCQKGSKGPECKVTFPDGQVQDCFVSISGNSSSSSCNVDLKATQANRSRGASTTAVAQGDPGSARRWQGTWKSTFGKLVMRPQGGRLTGTYSYCGGTLVGSANGGVLTGTWVEKPNACHTNRSDPSTLTGSFTFTLSGDGQSFAGTWSFQDSSKNPSDVVWSGQKLSN